ncbi:MAG: glycosyltransferase family 4 protein [Bacteroidales bacterium]|nr:glycosyltransferase family 4 protein [Bacteroidales bacterium]
MKVALIYHRLMLRGGLETRLFNYMNFFIKKGDEVTLICAKVAPAIKIPQEVKIIKLNLGITPKLYRQWNFSKKVESYLKENKFDLSLSLGRTVGQDLVLAPGNHLGFVASMNKRKLRKNDKLQIKLDRLSFEKSKLILACSKMIKDEIHSLYNIPPEKVKVLYPPIDQTKFFKVSEKEKCEIKTDLGLSCNKTSFVFVSSSHSRKGLPLLIDIFKELDSSMFELAIIGYPEVKTTIPNIKFLGFMEEPAKIYQAADYTIHPAKYEPFGQIITESLECGTPVIVSSMTGAKEIITKKTGVIIDSFKIEDWVSSINSLAKKIFDIESSFAEKSGLTLEQHINKMLLFSNELF